MVAQERSHKENLEQLRTKLIQEHEQLIKENKIMLEKAVQVGLLLPLVLVISWSSGEIM